jgi:hypothetical protein
MEILTNNINVDTSSDDSILLVIEYIDCASEITKKRNIEI